MMKEELLTANSVILAQTPFNVGPIATPALSTPLHHLNFLDKVWNHASKLFNRPIFLKLVTSDQTNGNEAFLSLTSRIEVSPPYIVASAHFVLGP